MGLAAACETDSEATEYNLDYALSGGRLPCQQPNGGSLGMAEPPLEGTHGFRRRLKENYLQLMSLKDEEDEWDRLESAVVGASGSVDAVVRARNGRLVPPIEEGLLLLADARLALRCVICLEDVTEQNQNARHSLEQTVSRLGASGGA